MIGQEPPRIIAVYRTGAALAASVAACWAAIVVAPAPAHAYLDPGTGSFVLQAIVGAALGAGFTIKVYWSKIKGFFSRSTVEPADAPGDDPLN